MGDGVADLEPCVSCGRHVRVSEAACPFCGAALDFGNVLPQLLPNERLSRSALMSFRTLVGAGVIGATTSALFVGCVVPVYGAPCPPDCLSDLEDAGDGGAETGTGGDAGSGGAPPPKRGFAGSSSEGGAGGEGGR